MSWISLPDDLFQEIDGAVAGLSELTSGSDEFDLGFINTRSFQLLHQVRQVNIRYIFHKYE